MLPPRQLPKGEHVIRSRYLSLGLLVAVLVVPTEAAAAAPDTQAAVHTGSRVYVGTTSQGTAVRFRLTRSRRAIVGLSFGTLTATCGDAPNQYTKPVAVGLSGPIRRTRTTFTGGSFGLVNINVYGAFRRGNRASGVIEYSDSACGTGGITWSARARSARRR